MALFELAAITDEASEDVEEALSACTRMGCGQWSYAPSGAQHCRLSPSQVERARALLRDKGMRVVSIASPFLKCQAPGAGAPDDRRYLWRADRYPR